MRGFLNVGGSLDLFVLDVLLPFLVLDQSVVSSLPILVQVLRLVCFDFVLDDLAVVLGQLTLQPFILVNIFAYVVHTLHSQVFEDFVFLLQHPYAVLQTVVSVSFLHNPCCTSLESSLTLRLFSSSYSRHLWLASIFLRFLRSCSSSSLILLCIYCS